MKKLLKLFTGFFLLIVIIHVFLINYTFNLDTTGISRNKVDIEWGSDDYNFTVVKKGIPIMFIPFTYGPSFFKVHIKEGPTFEVGNWRTNVWDMPDYDIKLTKTADKYILEFIANDTDYIREIQHYNLIGQHIDTTKEYYKNGQLRYVTPFFNGKKHGQVIRYNKNGKIDKVYTYNQGNLIREKSFVKDTFGNIIFITNR